MPYFITDQQPGCDGWATVKANPDDTLDTLACHATKQEAIDQMVAVSISEGIEPGGERVLPNNYRPSLAQDVPDGRACGNCFFYDESNVQGDKAWCKRWDEYVNGSYYCNAWQPDNDSNQDESANSYRAPAPPKDQITGSDANEPGSASGAGGDVKLGATTEKALRNKVTEHNDKMVEADRPDWTRTTFGQLAAVYRRGSGAYSTSHRPGISRAAWSMGRVNAFLYLLRTGAPENKNYVTDNDLLPAGHPKSTRTRNLRQVDLMIPEYIIKAAERGLEYHADGLSGDGLVDRTIREARQMARGEITSDKVIRANAWGARHKVDLDAPQNSNPDNDEWPGAGAVAFYLWGIDPLDPEPAMKWFESKSDAIKNEERSVSNAIQHRVGDTLFCMDEKRLETRRITLNDFELREAPEGDGMTFSGYAAVFNSESEPLPFRERIMPGAFDKSLRSRNDIRMYLNHDTGRVLASRRAGTLRLTEDQHGLLVEADLPPTTDGRDLSILMKRGDVDSMSFGFSVPSGGDWWSEDGNTRELREVRLHEVSVVTGFPAYTATTASVRSLDELIATQGVDPSFVESAMMKLSNGESITADEASLISSIVYELTESPDQIDPAAGIPDDMQELVNPEVEDEAPMGEVSESPAKVEIEIEVTVRELQRRQRELDLLMRRV